MTTADPSHTPEPSAPAVSLPAFLAARSEWDDDTADRQWRLEADDEAQAYALVWRPLAEAYDDAGDPLDWQDAALAARVPAPDLHASLGDALAALAVGLDTQEMALVVAPGGGPGGTGETVALLSTLETVAVALTRCGTSVPPALNNALAQLLPGVLRVRPEPGAAAVSWSVGVVVPLDGGGAGYYLLSSPAPVPVLA